MRRALACLPLALLFIAIVPSKAQKTGPTEDAEIVVVVREGAPLELACALGVEQLAEWRREGSSKLPEDLKVAKESAAGTGGLTARLHAKAARRELAGVYSCARGPQAQRLRVVVEPRAVPTAAADQAPTTVVPVTTPAPEITPIVTPVEGSPSLPAAVQYYDILRNMSFSCNIPNPGGEIYVWEKNNTDISKVSELKDRYKLEDNNGKLIIHRTSEEDAGNYTCKLADKQRYWELKARPYTKLPSSDSSVVEGQKLKLVCRVMGKPAVPVEWYYNKDAASYDEKLNKGEKLENTDRIKLETSEAGVENGQLVIEAAAREDAGAYACLPVVDEDLQRTPHANAVTVLRVKDMYAALWPFLGICAEVLVLCAIILVYEKRRTKPELDDSDTDNHDQKKS